MPDFANPDLESLEQLIKRALWDAVIDAQLAVLFASYPILGLWPFRSFISGAADLIGDHIFSELKLIVDLQAIRFVNDNHQREFDRAAVTLKIIARDYGIDSLEFLKARENASESLSRFVRFGAA